MHGSSGCCRALLFNVTQICRCLCMAHHPAWLPRAALTGSHPALPWQADSLEEVAEELLRRRVPFVTQTVMEGSTRVGQLVRH